MPPPTGYARDGLTPDDAKMLVSLGISAAIALVLFAIFCIARHFFKNVYIPLALPSAVGALISDPGRGAWFIRMFKPSDNEILLSHGAAAVLQLRLLRTPLLTFCFLAVLSLVILVPVNYAGTNKSASNRSPVFTAGSATITLANLQAGSSLFWVHLVMIYVFSIVWMCSVWADLQAYQELTLSERSLNRNCVRARTILITGIPFPKKIKAPAADAFVRSYFERIVPGQVEDCAVVRKYPKEVRKAWSNHFSATVSLEKAMCALERKPDKRPMTRLGYFGKNIFGLLGPKADAVDTFTAARDAAAATVAQGIADPNTPVLSQAFVTFNSAVTAQLLSSSVLADHVHHWAVHPAPAVASYQPPNVPSGLADDVRWHALGKMWWDRLIRSILVWCCCAIIAVFWQVPLTFLMSVLNLDTLTFWLRRIGLGGVTTFLSVIPPFAVGALTGFLPTLLVIIFMALLTPLLTLLTWLQGCRSRTEHTFQVVYKLFSFNLVSILFGMTLSGIIFSAIPEATDVGAKVGLYIQLIVSSIPGQSVFFNQWLMLKGFVSSALVLLRIGNLVLTPIKSKWLAKTPRAKLMLEWQGNFDPFYIAEWGLVVCILALYQLMVPMILVWATVYFALMYFAQRYNILYVYRAPCHSNPTWYPFTFHVRTIGLICFQVIMVVYLGSLRFVFAPLGILSVPLTCVFYYWWMYSYNPVTQHGAAERIADSPGGEDGNDGNDDKANAKAKDKLKRHVLAIFSQEPETAQLMSAEDTSLGYVYVQRERQPLTAVMTRLPEPRSNAMATWASATHTSLAHIAATAASPVSAVADDDF